MKKKIPNIYNYRIADFYEATNTEMINPDFFVFDAFKDPDNTHLNRPSRSEHFTFILVTAGEARAKLNLVNYVQPVNSFLILPPFLIHEFLGVTDDFAVTAMVFSSAFLGSTGLAKKHLDAFTFLASRNNLPLLLAEDEAKNLYALMQLLKTYNRKENVHLFIKEVVRHGFNMFMMELAAIFQLHRAKEIVKLTRKEELTMTFVKLLTVHFKEERSVQFYADAMFVTPKHLTKTIKEVTGHTSGEIIDDMVITEAKHLLNDLSFSVGNVADELHFSDQFFFSKFFKQHTGLSPTEYKATS